MTVSTELEKPLPEVNSINAPFWRAAAEHVLKIQHCSHCGRNQYPPLLLCPDCSSELEWVRASGRGTLYTFTIIRLVFNPAFAKEVPYNVSVVQLDEGPLMISNVVGVANEDLEIGQRLEVVYDDVAAGVSVPKFKLAEVNS